MIAKIHTVVTRDFVAVPTSAYDASVANAVFTDIEVAINKILSKIRKQGFFMEDIVLDRIDNITQFTSVMNANIDKINSYFRAMNESLSTSYMLGREILETMKVDVVNDDAISSIVIHDDKIQVELANGQIVDVKKDSITSTKGADVQEITHA